MPRAPLAAQRSIFQHGVLSPGGVDGAEGDESAAAGGCGVEDVVVGLAGYLQAGPAEAKGDGNVDVGFVHGLEQLGGGDGFGLGIAKQKSEGVVLTDYLVGGWS